MRGLVIQSPWIEKILNCQKSWEMRTSATGIRGEVALIKKGSGLILGVANLKGTKGPLSETDLNTTFDQHQIPKEFWSPFIDFKWRYAWVLDNVKPLQDPVPYDHPPGAMIWVNLNSETVESVRNSLGSKLSTANSIAQSASIPPPESKPPLQKGSSDNFVRISSTKILKWKKRSTLATPAELQETTNKENNTRDRKPGSRYRKKGNQSAADAGRKTATDGVGRMPNKMLRNLYRKRASQLSGIGAINVDPGTGTFVSETLDRPSETLRQGGRYQEITLTQGNINNGHINLSTVKDWLPDTVIGGSNKSELATETMMIDWGGPDPVFTDIAGDKMIFRSRTWVRDFFERYQLKEGDKISLEKMDRISLKIRPIRAVIQR